MSRRTIAELVARDAKLKAFTERRSVRRQHALALERFGLCPACGGRDFVESTEILWGWHSSCARVDRRCRCGHLVGRTHVVVNYGE